MMIGIGATVRTLRHTSSPSNPGSMMSRTMRSGGAASAKATASWPSDTIFTSYPSRSRYRPTTSATVGSSSTTRTWEGAWADSLIPPIVRSKSPGGRGVSRIVSWSGPESGLDRAAEVRVGCAGNGDVPCGLRSEHSLVRGQQVWGDSVIEGHRVHGPGSAVIRPVTGGDTRDPELTLGAIRHRIEGVGPA